MTDVPIEARRAFHCTRGTLMRRDIRSVKGQFRIEESGDDGGCGYFKCRSGMTLQIVYSWGLGWDHVSASGRTRCPTWAEMCEIRDFFFSPDEWVMQLHPPRADYINHHEHCLHLWRPQEVPIPTPLPIMV